MSKIGDLTQIENRLYFLWQIVRRHYSYIEFCDKYSNEFTENGFLNSAFNDEAEKIREIFNLDLIYHYSVDLTPNDIAEALIFANPFAVKYLCLEEKAEVLTPIWNNHYIHLEVDISPNRTEEQLKNEFMELVRNARKFSFEERIKEAEKELGNLVDSAATDERQKEIKKLKKLLRAIGKSGRRQGRMVPNAEDLKVYGLHKGDKSHVEIIKELWPKEYDVEWGALSGGALDKKYKKLLAKYKRENFPDYDEKAFYEVYGGDDSTPSGRIKLYMRVNDKLKKMRRLLEQFENIDH